MTTDYTEYKQRFALLIEYNGGVYSGSQYQSRGSKILPTIQSALNTALRDLNIKVSPVFLAGRTDAGVHAYGQVVHFNLLESDGLKNIPDLAVSLNAVLPETISVRQAVEVPTTFHSQLTATHRWYRYIILNRKERSAMSSAHCTWIKQPLNVFKMNQAARLLLGTHNFKSFKCPDTPITNDICHVSHSSVQRDGDFVIYDIVANRFLYKMVRNLMGVLIAIGREESQSSPERILEILSYQDRRYADISAKPEGLALMAINYPEELSPFTQDEYVQQLRNILMMESMQDENLFRKAS